MRNSLMLLFVLALFGAVHLHAQGGGGQQILPTTVDPTGLACTAQAMRLLTPGGTLFTCQSGTFAAGGGSGGSGTVTTVSVATANGVSGSVATPTTTPVITLTLGAIKPTSVSVGAAPALTPGTGAAIAYSEGTTPSVGPASGVDVVHSDSTLHCLAENANNGGDLPMALGPASVTTGHLATWGANGCLLADGGAVLSASAVLASMPKQQVSWTPGTIADGNCGQVAFTAQGATQNFTTMAVSVPSNLASGIEPQFPKITAANTVTIAVCNFSGATVNVLGGTWAVTFIN